MSDLSRAQILAELRTDLRIPVFPQVLRQMEAEFARGHDADLNRVCDLVEQDVGLATQFLKVAYSSLYPQVDAAISVRQAVKRIGLVDARQLALASGLTAAFDRTPSARVFWRHCVATGLATRVLVDLGRPELRAFTDIAFTAGLLHDVGALVLATLHPNEVAEVLAPERDIDGEIHIVHRERSRWGIDHAAVGRVVARKWGFPEELSAAIAFHHEPWSAEPQHQSLVLLVHLADFISGAYGLQTDFQAELELPDPEVWDAIGVSFDDVDTILAKVRALEEKTVAWVD